ncbi:MAG: heavy metal-associated domain-containing protein [Bacteroidota bacterium]
MKSIKITLFLFSLSAFFLSVQAQEAPVELKKNQAILQVKTSAQCGMCKERIEETLAFTKGVVRSELNLENKVLSIIYNSKKADPQSLKLAVAKVGYDADEVPAEPKAYDKLPECCQKGGHDKDH